MVLGACENVFEKKFLQESTVFVAQNRWEQEEATSSNGTSSASLQPPPDPAIIGRPLSHLQPASSHLGRPAEVGCRQSSSGRGRMQATLPSNVETVWAS